MLGDALATQAKTDPAASAQYILQMSTQPGTQAIYQQAAAVIATSLAKNDPAAMTKFVLQLPEGPAKARALYAGAEQIAKTDPKAAADSLSASRPSIDINEEVVAVVYTWAKKDMPSAMAYASALPGTEQTQTMTVLVPELAKTDPKSAIDVASKLNDRQVTDRLLYELPKALKIENADQALAAAGMPDKIKSGFLEKSAMAVVEKDLPSATRLLEQFPEGEVRNGATEGVIYALGRKDFSAAQSYVNSTMAGVQRDVGVNALIGMSYDHPDRGTQLALTLSGDQIRKAQLRLQYSRWVKVDSTAAQAWLGQAPLDDATRRLLANPQ